MLHYSFLKFPHTNYQNDDVPIYVQHSNIIQVDLETRFQYILTMEITAWITDSYGAIEETDDILQAELIGISTNEEGPKHVGKIIAWEHLRDICVATPI